MLSTGHLKRLTRTIKPSLTVDNKAKRVRFAFSFVDPDTLLFDPMRDIVHIDEKWFQEDVDKRTCLVVPGEELTERHRKSKHYIPKTMFLAPVACPRYERVVV
jgi:hypothetical protein